MVLFDERRSYEMIFFTSQLPKKKDMSSDFFLGRVFGFLEVINNFIMTSRVFWIKKVENSFWT
jgi:hypothetical protein